MNRVMFDLGFIQIKWYSFFIFFSVLVASFLIFKEAKKKEMNSNDLENLIFYGFLLSILGARIYYVLFNWSYYSKYPIEILQVWNGGLAIHGGLLAGIGFAYYYCRKKKLNMLLLLDVLVVGVIIAQAIGRWGNFFNQEAYGRIVSLEFLQNLHLPKFIIEGMLIDGYYREPTFLYESVLSILGFILLIMIKRIPSLKVGQLTGTYLIWYGLERIFIEALRSDSLMLGPFRIAQVVSVLFIGFGTYLVLRRKQVYQKEKLK